MESGSLSIVRGAADRLDCDAWLVAVTSTGLSASAAAQFAQPAFARKKAQEMAFGRAHARTIALKGATEADALRVLARPDLFSRDDASQLAALTSIFADAARAAEAKLVELGRQPRGGRMSLAIPCPSTVGWFSRFGIQSGAVAMVTAARQVAMERHLDIVVCVQDERLYRELQSARALAPAAWWPALGANAFGLLATWAREIGAGKAAVFVDEGVTGSDFDAGMRAVANRFGLRPDVLGHGRDGRDLLTQMVDRCTGDSAGARRASLEQALAAEFARDRFSVSSALVASMPLRWCGNLAFDNSLELAFGRRFNTGDSPPHLARIGSTYLLEDAPSPPTSTRPAPDQAARLARESSRMKASTYLFLGVDVDGRRFRALLDDLAEAVPGFASRAGHLISHRSFRGERPTGRAGRYGSVTATARSFVGRQRALAMILDALTALVESPAPGVYPAAKPKKQEFPFVRADRGQSVFTYNAGLMR